MSVHSQTISPLTIIRNKERALAQEITAAQERANALIAQARARADAIKTQAEQDGMRDAEVLYQDGLARARRELSEIDARGKADAIALGEAGRARIQEAVEYIIRFVLPENEKDKNAKPLHRPQGQV